MTEASASPRRLKMDSRDDLHKFLKAMQPKFLEVVHPRESGLLDLLFQSDLLTETDNESMSGKDVNIRKDQARKLWFHLNKIPPEDFKAHVFPKLLKDYPHIIPQGFLAQGTESASAATDLDRHQECLRHDIMSKIRRSSFADMLYHGGGLSLEDYEDITSDDWDSDVWTKMLDSFSCHSEDVIAQLLDPLLALLQKHKIHFSNGLHDVMSNGFPCMCSRGSQLLPASPLMPLRKVGSWALKSKFSQSPRSYGRSCSSYDAVSCSSRTGVCSADSQSLGSDSVDPDFPARCRQKHIGLLQVANHSESSQSGEHSDAQSVTMEIFENPTRAADLGDVVIGVPEFYECQGHVTQTKTNRKSEKGNDTDSATVPEKDQEESESDLLKYLPNWHSLYENLTKMTIWKGFNLLALCFVCLFILMILALNQYRLSANQTLVLADIQAHHIKTSRHMPSLLNNKTCV